MPYIKEDHSCILKSKVLWKSLSLMLQYPYHYGFYQAVQNQRSQENNPERSRNQQEKSDKN